jgi:urease subunit alpha
MMARISRKDYAAMYGPSSGDAVRLGDTSLMAEIEHDYAVPGDECLHGGGKTLRDGMGLKSGYDSSQGSQHANTSGHIDAIRCNTNCIDTNNH